MTRSNTYRPHIRIYYEKCDHCREPYHREEAHDAGIPAGYCSDQCAEDDQPEETT